MDGTSEIWGILNVTPDSFSDGGRFGAAAEAVAAGRALLSDGAHVLDIGGESTRPGAASVSREEEIARVRPVLAGLRAAGVDIPLSIDTRHAAVAAAALASGATIVNDVSAGADPDMFGVVAEHKAALVLMHMQGTPATMQAAPAYEDVVAEVRAHLLARAHAAEEAGIERERLWIDPGIGFGKTLAHNLALLANLESLVATGYPVLLGASRKSFLGTLSGRTEARERLAGSLACALRAQVAGVRAVRVHDVRETREALQVYAAIG
jgi:dihydropteroate synthase